MTKRKLASLFFKLIGVYLFVSSLSWFCFIIFSAMNIRLYDLSTLIAPICQVIATLVYMAVLFLLIVKSDILAARLIKEDESFNLSLLVDRDEILMLAFCCIGLSLLIGVIQNIISVFIEAISYIRHSNLFPNDILGSYWSQVRISKLVSIVVNSVIGIYLFIYPKKVIGLWEKVKKDDSKGVSYQFGDAKSIDDLSLDDIQEYPIWILVTDKGQQGTFVKPVINSHDVTNDLLEPIIGFRVEGSEVYGSSDYDAENHKLVNLTLWIDGKWVLIQDTSDLVPPFTLVAIPKINGKDNVKFKYESFENSEANLMTDD